MDAFNFDYLADSKLNLHSNKMEWKVTSTVICFLKLFPNECKEVKFKCQNVLEVIY